MSLNGKKQLVSFEEDGILATRYRYDAAGRLVEEGGKSYRYGWLDKVVSVSEEGQVTATFGYHAGGQLAAATHGDKTESFLWDGLALIRRDGTDYVNEPHAGGGAPVLAGDRVLFNDLLGSTLGAKDANGFKAVQRTAFGETGGKSTDEFFTGKPMVGELGYAFLFRNYRPEHGKWQTADLMGYPDGWNNLAYCNNRLTDCVDWMGGDITSSGFETYFEISLSIIGTRPGDDEPSNYTQFLKGTAEGSASCNHNFNNPVFSDFKVNKGESSLSLSSANGVDSITYGGKTYKPSMSFSFSIMLTSSTAILNEELSDERNKVFDLSITFNYVVSWTRTETGSFVTLTSDAFTGSKTINWRHTIPE